LEDNDDDDERRMFHIEIDQEIETDQEDDGRWIAAIPILPGVLAARRFIRNLS